MKLTEEQVQAIVVPCLKADEEFLVSVSVSPQNEIKVRVDAYHGVPIERCVELSRIIEGAFNRDETDYSLEVSSAGLDAPFTVAEQYRKHVGDPISVLLKSGVRKDGTLLRLTEDGLVLSPIRNNKGSKHKEALPEEEEIKKEEIKEARYRF